MGALSDFLGRRKLCQRAKRYAPASHLTIKKKKQEKKRTSYGKITGNKHVGWSASETVQTNAKTVRSDRSSAFTVAVQRRWRLERLHRRGQTSSWAIKATTPVPSSAIAAWRRSGRRRRRAPRQHRCNLFWIYAPFELIFWMSFRVAVHTVLRHRRLPIRRRRTPQQVRCITYNLSRTNRLVQIFKPWLHEQTHTTITE